MTKRTLGSSEIKRRERPTTPLAPPNPSLVNTTSAPTERCEECRTAVPAEWIPPIQSGGKLFAGTGVWRSTVTDGLCASCRHAAEVRVAERRREQTLRFRLVSLAGGEKPYREFRFETFAIAAQNEAAFAAANTFNPSRNNLYLWGACGVGKTHLAFSIARRWAEKSFSVDFLKPPQLMRKVRRKDPDEEQHAIDRLVRADIFVLDDLGIGHETAYARQILQEILDGREFAYRAGLIVTSKYSLGALAVKLDDDTISSRLAGLCRVIEISGPDGRLRHPRSAE